MPLQALIFFGSGMYRGMWRYASVPDLQRIALAVVLSTLSIALALLMLPREEPPVPRSVLLLDPILLILILGGSRIGYRVWKERRLRNVLGSRGRPVTILGAGDAAADLLKNLARADDWRVVGLLDDNPTKRGRQIQGVNILGALDELVELAPRLIKNFQVETHEAGVAYCDVPYPSGMDLPLCSLPLARMYLAVNRL